MSNKLTRKEKRESRLFVREMAKGEFESQDWVLSAMLRASNLKAPSSPENFLDVDAAQDYAEQMEDYAKGIESLAEQVRAAHDSAKDRGAEFAGSHWWYMWHCLRTMAGEVRHSGSRVATMAKWIDRMEDSEFKRSIYAKVKDMEKDESE